MPADVIVKKKVLKRNFECLIDSRENATVLGCVQDMNLIKCFTDGSKINEKVGAGFYIEYPTDTPSVEEFFYLGKQSTVFKSEVFAISEAARKLLWEQMSNRKIVILVDSQAAIKAIKTRVRNSFKSVAIKNTYKKKIDFDRLTALSSSV